MVRALIIGTGIFLCTSLTERVETRYDWPRLLSEWNIFIGDLADLQPVINAIPYRVRSELYSDYAHKNRFILLPPDMAMQYREDGPLSLPDGTVLVKTFFYPKDFRKSQSHGRQIMETRIFTLHKGEWHGASYIWNAGQTDAQLSIAGEIRPVSWKDINGKSRSLEYVVPNMNQCANCHTRDGVIQPLGVTARQLNHGGQLEHLNNQGQVVGMPEVGQWPLMPDYSDPATGDVETRARAYLDVNCGHCHSPFGPANSSALYLQYTAQDDHALGLHKPPIAAGRGSGGRKYNIVPGKPKASILLYRMESDDPGIRMPEINRQIPHTEGIALIREWIKRMR